MYYEYPSTSTVHTTFVHPEYQYWRDTWRTLRDCYVGEMEIKRKGDRYLPKLEDMTKEEYAAYVERAVFFNMTLRTLVGLLGTLFNRNPVVENMPPKLDTSNCSKLNQTLMQFVREVARELIHMGRYGVLLDMDDQGKRPPYFAGYIAENIVDWTVREIEGRWVLTEIILRELRLARPILNPISLTPAGQILPNLTHVEMDTFSQDSAVTRAARRWIASYRVLRLEGDPDAPGEMIYRQYYHTSERGDASPEGTPYAKYTPTNRGRPFRFIPFMFFGPFDNKPDADKSPLLDIARLNVSHYRSYAQLEHGRFFTAMPIYYAQVPEGQNEGSYTIGSSVVWEVAKGDKPGILEFNGSGLKYLTEACDKKEDQIAALGGRLVGVERVSAGQSNNNLMLKEANEQALLLNVANVIDVGMTALIRWWAIWQDVSPEEAAIIGFETNKDFLLNKAGAREYRAIQMMYEAGIIPVEVLYDFLRRAEVVPDWMSMKDFTTSLKSADSFPNMADVRARQRGAPDAKTEWETEHVLLDPQVVAVRGYDSQAPAGQQPLPGQIIGGPISLPVAAPPPVSAPPALGPDGKPVPPKLGPDGKPVQPPAPVTPPPSPPPTGPVQKTPPRQQAGGKTVIKDAVGVDDIGQGTPGQPAAGSAGARSGGGGLQDGPELNQSQLVAGSTTV